MSQPVLSEFELIRRYFQCAESASPSTILGIGDDAAIVAPTMGHQLLISKDVLVCDRHFFADVQPRHLGHKALAVNLSDMAAMGAQPRWVLLGLTLPTADVEWLEAFCAGFFALARQYKTTLIGGDTTRGALTISVTILGEAPVGIALQRSAACVNDDIWVSGDIGWAGLALAARESSAIALSPSQAKKAQCALELPQPQIELGLALRDVAHAAIDISDGLLADLAHIVVASSARSCTALQAKIQLEHVPLPDALCAQYSAQHALTAGDDYQLCFTAAPQRRAEIQALAASLNLKLSRIGTMVAAESTATAQSPVIVWHQQRPLDLSVTGFDHFSAG